MNTQQLPPLRVGDHVLVQNQKGSSPDKWDRSGVIVESKDHDKYLVKIAGTGILTLRNRQFLRRYTPHFKQGPAWRFEHSTSQADDQITYAAPQTPPPTALSNPSPQTNTEAPNSRWTLYDKRPRQQPSCRRPN